MEMCRLFCFCKQKTAYVMRISDWSADVCSSDLIIDKTGEIVAMAREYDVTVTIESCPMLTVKTLAQALDVISAVNLPNFKLLIDTMHIVRSGESEDIVRLDPMLIDNVPLRSDWRRVGTECGRTWRYRSVA